MYRAKKPSTLPGNMVKSSIKHYQLIVFLHSVVFESMICCFLIRCLNGQTNMAAFGCMAVYLKSLIFTQFLFSHASWLSCDFTIICFLFLHDTNVLQLKKTVTFQSYYNNYNNHILHPEN